MSVKLWSCKRSNVTGMTEALGYHTAFHWWRTYQEQDGERGQGGNQLNVYTSALEKVTQRWKKTRKSAAVGIRSDIFTLHSGRIRGVTALAVRSTGPLGIQEMIMGSGIRSGLKLELG